MQIARSLAKDRRKFPFSEASCRLLKFRPKMQSHNEVLGCTAPGCTWLEVSLRSLVSVLCAAESAWCPGARADPRSEIFAPAVPCCAKLSLSAHCAVPRSPPSAHLPFVWISVRKRTNFLSCCEMKYEIS